MFQNDENEKQQYETVYKECLLLTNMLQIIYKCAFHLVEKSKLSDDKSFGQKSTSDK